MSDPKDPGEDPIADGGTSAPIDEEAPQPWGAGARPPRNRRTRLWAAAAAVVAVVVVAVGVTAWLALEGSLPRGPDPALLALDGRIDRLAAEVARLDAARPAARSGEDEAALATIQATVSRLTARLGALEASPVPGSAAAAPPDGRIAALTERLAALERAGAWPSLLAERLEKLERRVASETGSAADDRSDAALARVSAENQRLAAALERMSGQIAGLEARRAEAAEAAAARQGLDRDLRTVAGRLARLEAKAARLADAAFTRKGDALLLAIGQLRDAMASDRPFTGELGAVLRIAGAHSFVTEVTAPIGPLAARGIATQAQLVARFPRLAAMAAQAAIAPEDGGWISRAVARLAQVVTVRRVGADVSGETAMAALARAEAKLASGDLAGAEAALDPLAGKPAEVLADWRAAAAARTAARAAIARLSSETIARLSRAAGADADGGTDRAANGAAR